MSNFPTVRPRRLRQNESLRTLFQETEFRLDDLISGRDCAWLVPPLGSRATLRLLAIRSLFETRVLESTTGILPRGTLEHPWSTAIAVKAGNNHLFTSHPLQS